VSFAPTFQALPTHWEFLESSRGRRLKFQAAKCLDQRRNFRGNRNLQYRGFIYFYFIAAAWKGWTVISAVMGGVGLYWLSAEFLNWLSAEYLNPDQR
jgi:hypothetical protein